MLDLSKGATPLLDNTGRAVSDLSITVSWQSATEGKGFSKLKKLVSGVDLDVSLVALNEQRRPVSCAYQDQPTALGGAIHHCGDSRGRGSNASETVEAYLATVPHQVHYLVCTLSSYGGETFQKINEATYKLVDLSSEEPLATNFVPIDQQSTAAILAVVRRQPDNTWTVTPMEVFGNGKTWQELAELAKRTISVV